SGGAFLASTGTNRPLCSSVPMKQSHWCNRLRSTPAPAEMPACGKRSATYCGIAGVSEIGAVVLHDLGLSIDLEVISLRASFIQRDPGRHRAGERREIKIHRCL